MKRYDHKLLNDGFCLTKYDIKWYFKMINYYKFNQLIFNWIKFMAILSYKKFPFSFLDSIQDTSTVPLYWKVLTSNVIIWVQIRGFALLLFSSSEFHIPHMAVTSGVWLDFKHWSQWIGHDNKSRSIVRSKMGFFL